MEGKAEKTVWLNTLSGSIGVVAFTNAVGEKSVRIAPVSGTDLQGDIQRVVDYGAKLTKENLKELTEFLEDVRKEEEETKGA